MGEPRFEDVYREHFAYVWRSLERLGVERRALEDVAQDVFVVAYRRLPAYDRALPFRPWLFGIAFNVVRERRRRLRRKPRPAVLDHEVRDDDRAFATVEAARTLHGMLARLSAEKRAVIILCDLDGQSAVDAAAALGLSVEAVYSRLRRARAELSRMAARDDDEEPVHGLARGRA